MMLKRLGAMALLAVAATVGACGDDDETGPGDPTGIAISVTSVGLPGGEDIDVLIDGLVQFNVTSNGTSEFTKDDLAPDTYTVTLAPPAGCASEPAEHVVTVEEGEIEEISFAVTCGLLTR